MSTMRSLCVVFLLVAACSGPPPALDGGGDDGSTDCASSCAVGQRCVAGACEAGCSENADCGESGVCDVENNNCACSGTAHLCGGGCYAFDDPAACGRGCDVCDAPANAAAACDGAACSYACNLGHHLCGGACAPDDDPASCGNRCTPCPGGDGGTAACEAGTCTLSCDPGRTSCAGRCADTETDNDHCGSCGAPCMGATICQAGVCAPLACPAVGVCPGRSWCDTATNSCTPGCDRDDVCPTGETCDVATHECVCAAGTHLCGAACTPDTSIDSCGDSCVSCAGVANGSATCDSTSCGLSCDPGFHVCAGACVPDDSAGACGASCTVCPAPSDGSALCTSGTCAVSCDGGFHECRGGCYPDGMPDPCSCTPMTCAALGATCGMVDDGCGTMISCGTCTAGTCGAAVPNVCGSAGGTGICVRPGWCWEHPYPADLDLNSVHALATDDVWVAGEDGVVMRWNGTAWSRVPGLTSDQWFLSGTGPSNVWASGFSGAARWDGSAWVDRSRGEADSGVWSLSPAEAWASSHDSSDTIPRMHHWDGTAWIESAPSLANRCSAVIGTAADNVWAGCRDGHVRWNGRNWLLPVGGMWTTDYDRAPTGELFAVGSSVQRHNGVDWIAAGIGSGLYDRLSVLAMDEIWFAGWSTNVLQAAPGGDVTHTFSRDTLDVDAIASDDVWVVGDDYLLEHWNGTSWTSVREDAFSGQLNAITDGTHGAGWAVGDAGVVVRFDGARWVRVSNTSSANLNGVWARSPTQVWAVGDTGTILDCGTSGCTQVTTSFTEDLQDVWGPSASAVWTVGESGRIATYDGSAWAAIASPTATHLYAVHGVSATDLWIGGMWAIHWNGTIWDPVHVAGVGASDAYTSIYAAASDDVWFASGETWMDHWDGTNVWLTFTPRVSLRDTPVSSVFGVGARTFVLSVPLGEPSHVFERVGTSWVNRGSRHPYTFGGTARHAAAMMADGSMRFLRARDNFRGFPASWKDHAIMFYDPVRATP